MEYPTGYKISKLEALYFNGLRASKGCTHSVPGNGNIYLREKNSSIYMPYARVDIIKETGTVGTMGTDTYNTIYINRLSCTQ